MRGKRWVHLTIVRTNHGDCDGIVHLDCYRHAMYSRVKHEHILVGQIESISPKFNLVDKLGCGYSHCMISNVGSVMICYLASTEWSATYHFVSCVLTSRVENCGTRGERSRAFSRLRKVIVGENKREYRLEGNEGEGKREHAKRWKVDNKKRDLEVWV